MKLLLLAAFALGASRTATAQPYPNSQIPPYDEPGGGGPALSDADVHLLSYLHEVHQLEIQVGRLAWNRGSEPVREFGAQLVNDHIAADQRLTAFARSRGIQPIPVDTQLDPDHRSVVDALSSMQTAVGTAFDDAFLGAMVDAQEREQSYVEAAISSSDDAELEQILRDTDTMLRQHVIDIHTLQTLVP